MASPRKPKKAFIQFAVAAVIALVVGGIGIVLLFLLFTGVAANNEIAQQEQQAELKKKEKKLAALEAQMKKLENGKRPTATAKKYKEVQIAMAVPRGTPIEESMLKEIELAPGERPAMNSFSRIASVVGQVSAMDLLAGETVTKAKLLDTEGMVAVSDGKRAITIKVDNIGAVGGAVSAGTYVDVLATFTHDQLTKTLLQNVRVVSAGPPKPSGAPIGGKKASMPKKAGAKDAVTLEVSPEEAEMMALANKESIFHLSLRGFGDVEEKILYGTDIGELMSGVSRAALEQSAPENHGIPNLPNDIPVSYSGNPNDLPEPAVPEPEDQTFQMEIYKGANSESKDFQWQY